MTRPIQHTPGPWELQPNSRDHGETSVICTLDGYVIATIPTAAWMDVPACDEAEQDRANALLMCSAQGLLDALEEISEQWVNGRMVLEGVSLPVAEKVRAAIAKAKGESHD